MITKSDLQKANDELLAAERARLGDPPTAGELAAYARGELAPEAEARVRDLLVAYPELTGALLEPFPTEPARPGDADYLPDAEFATHWASLQQRMKKSDRAETGMRVVASSERDAPAATATAAEAHDARDAAANGRVLRFQRRISFALAAMLLLAFGGNLWQAAANRHLAEPRVVGEEQSLAPDGRRGIDEVSTKLSTYGDAYLVGASLIGPEAYPHYRAELLAIDADPPRLLWSGNDLQRGANDTFTILIPHEFLAAGSKYQLVLFGVDGARKERLASYTLRVPR
jgi:hypothetical protein